DNSGSMGDEQANLAANFQAMVAVLEEKDVDANYRIGVTTSDNGNLWCTDTTPEAGRLQASSCRDRLDSFVFDSGMELVDVSPQACLDICEHDGATLVIQPTTTDYDSNPTPRPWLERIEGKSNLPAGISTAAAFACLAPQGIDGCGFESQLESMYLALLRSGGDNEDSYGFLRRSAILAIIIVSDEVDCSANPAWSEIFDPNGDKVFWSDPNTIGPSSALCWNAGVVCDGDPSAYDCHAADYDVSGQLTDDSDDAVLHPLALHRSGRGPRGRQAELRRQPGGHRRADRRRRRGRLSQLLGRGRSGLPRRLRHRPGLRRRQR
ncbi:MAG: hypothetical protein KC431_25260, partial [Myxococcales bacterium]|nr:hypothetical protein [Myxococcales bacterium]